MAHRLAQLFAVVFAVVVLAAQASEGRAQAGNPQQVLTEFLFAQKAIGDLLEQAEAARVSGDCREFSGFNNGASNLLATIYSPKQIGAEGHARLRARVAAQSRLPCPSPRPSAQPGGGASDAYGLTTQAGVRQEVSEVIEGAFADLEAALLAGDCRRRERQLAYLDRMVGPQGTYGRPGSKTFAEPVKLDWQQRLRELFKRPCSPPKPPESSDKTPTAAPKPSEIEQLGSALADIIDIEARLDALLAAAEEDRRQGICWRFLNYIDDARDLLSSQKARRLADDVIDPLNGRISDVDRRPCPPTKAAPRPPPVPSPTPAPPPPPPVLAGTLGGLRLALAKACGAQFEPARAALLARIDREILTTAGDPKRLAALVEDRAYIAGLPVKPCPPPAPSPLMTGTFITNFGTMVLVEGRGAYTEQNGRVTPTRIDGLRLEATWEQTASARRCADGRYRGKLTFAFGSTGFSGFWGYCDEPPSNAWSGQRR